MAKSLRSKFKRKVRAIRRIRNAPKELKMLQTAVEKRSVHELAEATKNSESTNTDESTAMDVTTSSGGLNLKTMKLKDGSYPQWMNQRKVKKAQTISKAAKKAKLAKKKKNR